MSSLTPTQQTDLNIVLSLKTPEQIQQWMDAVGYEDTMYGIALIKTAICDDIDTWEVTKPVENAVKKLCARLTNNV